MKSSLRPILGFALACAFTIFLRVALGLWNYSYDSCYIFSRVSKIVYEGELSLAGQSYCCGLMLGPLADYLTSLPLFIFKRVEATYLFVSVLWLVSVPLFFIVIRRYFNDRVAFWASITYFFSMPVWELRFMPWNDSYLPICLPVYLYLIMEGRDQLKHRLFTYILLGLMAQLHILTLTLIPTSWVFWRLSSKTRTPILLHLAGFLSILILHLPLAFFYAKVGIGAIRNSFSNMVQGFKLINSEGALPYFAFAIVPLFYALLLAAPALIILIPLSVNKWKSISDDEKKSILANLTAFLSCLYLCSLAAQFIKGYFNIYYITYSLPFLVTLAGIFAQIVIEHYKRSWRVAIGLSMLLPFLVIVLHLYASVILYKVPTRDIRVQLWLAEKFSKWANENNISPVQIMENVFSERRFFLEDFKAVEEMPPICLPSLIEASGHRVPNSGKPRKITLWELKESEEESFILEFDADLKECSERWEHKGAVFYICPHAVDSR